MLTLTLPKRPEAQPRQIKVAINSVRSERGLLAGEPLAHAGGHLRSREAEVLGDDLVGRRVAEVVDADGEAVGADPRPSTDRCGRLRSRRASPSTGSTSSRQLASCAAKTLEARQRHDAHARAAFGELARRLDGDADLGAGRHEDDVGRAALFAQDDVAAASSRRSACVPGGGSATFWRERMSSVGPSLRSSAAAHAAAHSSASAGRHTCTFGMSRSADTCSTDWCVGPSSPRNTESCVKTCTTCRLRQRGEADRRAHVVAEREERRGERDEHAVVANAVGDRAHRVLADAEVHVAPFEVARLNLGRRP